MLGHDEAAEARDGRQARHQHRLARALGEDPGVLLLGEPVEDVDAVGDADADDEREHHDVGRVERDPGPTHEAHHPDRPDRDRQQREHHAADTPEMQEHQHDDRRERPPCGLDVRFLQQLGVEVELHRGPGRLGRGVQQLFDEDLLRRAFPDVGLGIDLDQMLAGHAEEAVAQRLRQVLGAQAARGVLVLQGGEGVADVVEQRLLEGRQLRHVAGPALGTAAEHRHAQAPQGVDERAQVGQQTLLVGLGHFVHGEPQIALRRPERRAELVEPDRSRVRRHEPHRRGRRADLPDERELGLRGFREVPGHRIGRGDRRQLLDLRFERDGLREVRRDDGAVEHGFLGRIDQLVLEDDGGEALALHVQQVVVEGHPRHRRGREQARHAGHAQHRPRPVEPEALQAGARIRSLAAGLETLQRLLLQLRLACRFVDHVLPARAQQQHRQQCHHRHQADHHAAAGHDTHLLDALEIRQRHREERARRGETAGEDALPRVHHRQLHRPVLTAAVAQLLLVARDEVDAEIDRQSDEHRHEGDREDVEMADGERGVAHSVAEPDDEAEHGLERAAGLAVAGDEDDGRQRQRDDRGDGRIVLRLLHLVVLEHRFAGDADVDAGHLGPRLLDQLAELVDGVGVQVAVARLGRDEVEPALAEGDVLVPLRFLARAEQRVHARRRRDARPVQALFRAGDDPSERGQGLEQRTGPLVLLAAARPDLRVHPLEQRDEVRRRGELLEEGLVIRERLLQLDEVRLRHEQQSLPAHQLEVALVEDVDEQIGRRRQRRRGLQAGAEPLDELAVLLRVLRFDDGDQVVLPRELFLQREEIPVVGLVRSDQRVAVHVELEPRDGEPDADAEEDELRPDEPSRVREDRRR